MEVGVTLSKGYQGYYNWLYNYVFADISGLFSANRQCSVTMYNLVVLSSCNYYASVAAIREEWLHQREQYFFLPAVVHITYLTQLTKIRDSKSALPVWSPDSTILISSANNCGVNTVFFLINFVNEFCRLEQSNRKKKSWVNIWLSDSSNAMQKNSLYQWSRPVMIARLYGYLW